MSKLKVLIVDDEIAARENLNFLLSEYCNVEVQQVASSPMEALTFLSTTTPDVIFLDIHMPEMNGIDFANRIKSRNIPIVFITAFDQYAIRAFKASAIDYILKPTTKKELQESLEKVRRLTSSPDSIARKMEISLQTFNENNHFSSCIKHISVPWKNGFKIVKVSEILYVHSDNSYVELILTSSKLFISKSIGELEDILSESNFYRVHNRYLINLDFIDTFSNEDGGNVILKNGKLIPISRRRLSGFKVFANQYFQHF